ncbi:MAG: GNAT family N-acetyltransferase [Bacteroidetes bacterium]|nr:GNAT family N-acetyltransferase [Bacteroidota bacterium]
MKDLTELLNRHHDQKNFSCGVSQLDIYIKKHAGQDVKRKLAACFVASDEKKVVKGYYTLSNGSVPMANVSEEIYQKLPTYKDLPVTLLGRLAIDKTVQGTGLGELLLIDALKRSLGLSSLIGSFAVIVDPINSSAEKFYSKYGFIKLPDNGKMFLSMATIRLGFER